MKQEHENEFSPFSLGRFASLHWFHWFVVGFSFALTFFAWYFSKEQVYEKIRFQFMREARQTVELVQERMQKYEDGLWGGVSAIQANGGDISYEKWKVFADSLRIEVKYPGIMGIGVIHNVPQEKLESYLEYQRKARPEFHLHPKHDKKDFLPITYIEPVESNNLAVGLDMVHESNRYLAALKARDTGKAQITGPIILVQDADKTPGFLFYAPFYKGGPKQTREERRESFVGMVYAPFVVKDLMRGVLHKERRHVGIQISDAGDILYDENLQSEEYFEEDPLFTKRFEVDLYGRKWIFDVQSTRMFRQAAESNQPLTILIGGILIDSLIIILFLSLAGTNKKAMAYAERMNRELIQKSENLEKINKDLEYARLEAIRANNAKSIFLANMSHEIRTPMNAIMGYAQILLRDKSLNKETREAIQVMDTSGNALMNLLNDILDISKIEAGKMEVHVANMNLGEIINSLGRIYGLRCQERGLTFRFQKLVDPIWVRGDEGKIRQVLVNLLGNALKFTDSGEIRFSVFQLPDNAYRFEVSDTGPGIAEESHQTVFEAFAQDDMGSQKGGTGLGLAICDRLVQLMGSKLKLESRLGEGARFSFNLTLPPADLVHQVPLSSSSGVLRMKNGYDVQALVVDDVKENRDVLTRLLSDIGVRVEEAEDGKQCLDLMKQKKPDIVLMDIRMPRMNGEEAIRLIRQESAYRDVRVVAITASAFDRHLPYYLKLGFDDYISKPFREDRLFQCLRDLLDINFVYDREESAAGGNGTGNNSDADHVETLVPLPEELMARLKKAVELYNITQIEKAIEELRGCGEEYRPMVNQLMSHVKAYNMDAIMKLLNHSEKSPSNQ